MLFVVYPNNEFRLTCGMPRAPRKSDVNAHERDRRMGRVLRRGDGSPLPLDPCAQLSQASKRKRPGLGPITKDALSRIRHLGGCFQDDSRYRQVFVTGTLPGSTDAAMEAFGRLSGYVIKLIQTYVPRSLGVHAEELRYLWVWEHQRRGALHLHACFECPDVEVAKKLVSLWRQIWNSVLSAASAKAPSGVDVFARRYGGTHREDESKWQSDAQMVKKSVRRYLSKYQSKGSSGGSRFRPSRWYGASKSLRVSCRSRTLERSWYDHSCPKDSASVIRIRRSIVELISPLLGWGEIRSTRGDSSWCVDLIGFLSEDTCGSGLIDMIREKCGEFLNMHEIVQSEKDREKAQRRRIKAFVSAYYESSLRFRECVEANLAGSLVGLEDFYDIDLDQAMDLRHQVNSQLFAFGYVSDSARYPAWVRKLRCLTVSE